METPPEVPVRIRRMQADDLVVVQQIDQVSFSQPWPARSFEFEFWNNPAARMWVAEALLPAGQMQVCAMMVVWLVIDEAHIGTIAVHPDFRRRGIAMQLIKQGLHSLREEGARSVYLEVRRSNTGAQALYEKLGFELVSVRKEYYHNNREDALIYMLNHLQVKNFS